MMSLDDLLMADCIENAVRALSQSENIAFCANTGHFEIDQDGSIIADAIHLPRDCRHYRTAHDLLELEYENLESFYVQGRVFRRDILQAVEGFDDTMTGDDIVLRTRLFQYMIKNPQVDFLLGNNVTLCYRKHKNNLHLNGIRQTRTVIEWKEKYFPDRDYPPLFYKWLEGMVENSLNRGQPENLQIADDLNPEVAEFIRNYEAYRETWKFRRVVIKRKIKTLLRRFGLLSK